jgi:hypothetical protein
MPFRRSQHVWAGQLVPEMEAICGDGLIGFRAPPPGPTRPRAGDSRKRADGIRTHDLLHGN